MKLCLPLHARDEARARSGKQSLSDEHKSQAAARPRPGTGPSPESSGRMLWTRIAAVRLVKQDRFNLGADGPQGQDDIAQGLRLINEALEKGNYEAI